MSNKKETIEEFAKKIANDIKHSKIKLDYQDGIYYGIEIGAKWQAEQEKKLYSDEDMQEYENWVKDAEKESNLSDLNDKANAFWSGYRAGVKAKERMYSEENMHEYAEFIVRCYLKKLPLIIAKDWFQEIKKI